MIAKPVNAPLVLPRLRTWLRVKHMPDKLRPVTTIHVATASLCPADAVARYGGDEFVVLLPKTPHGGAQQVAHGALDAVAALGIAHRTTLIPHHVAVSAGVACYDDESACRSPASADSRLRAKRHARCTPIDLVQAADKALHWAKHAGRAQSRLLDIADADMPSDRFAR